MGHQLGIIVPFLDQVSINGAYFGQYLYLEDLQNVNKSDRTTSQLFNNSTIHDGFTKVNSEILRFLCSDSQ